MTPERSKMVEHLYQAAQAREPAHRNAFLTEACGGDQDLQREVEALLALKGASGEAETVAYPPSRKTRKRLTAGSRLGPYRILAAIGSGGMGDVYRGRDPRLGRDVAIKVLPEHMSQDPQALARFEREAQAVATLTHPNILAIFDVGSDRGLTYAVTELLEGESLGTRVKRGPIPWQTALDIGIAVAEALAAAHAKGLIHRDLKPDNIFLTTDERVKLLDFGLARRKTDVLTQGDSRLATQTLAGTIMGTMGYMSPEQVRGETADAPSDIFSFGCVLYEMITGKRAFKRPSPAETMAAILKEEPSPPDDPATMIPFELDQVIASCLAKERRNRFQFASELVSTLKAVKDNASRSSISTSTTLAGAVREAPIDSVAVLPFVNTGSSPELEYLTDGITESLINSLSQLRNIRVVARSTAFKYKSVDTDPEAIGRSLNVRAVLTGRVMQRGETLNVQTELVDVLKGSQVWGEQYSHKLADIFVVQEEIAKSITKKLRLKLSREQKNRLTRRYTENSEAYQLYLRGRFYWNKRTPEWMRKGLEHFQLALEKDPGYALAYAGMADCYAVLGSYSILSPKDGFGKAKVAALKALEIDKSLAEAHSSLAYVKGFYDWNWAESEAEFKHAIELSPSYPTAHQWYAFLLTAVGRQDEALARVQKALELDPLSLAINSQLSWVLYISRRYDEGIQQAQRALEMDSKFGTAHFWLGLNRLRKGKHAEAIASFQATERLIPGNPQALSALGYAHGLAGHHDEAREILHGLQEAEHERYVGPLAMAMVHIGLGEWEQAFEWLQKGVEDRSWWLAWLKVDPSFDPLRSDARFPALLSRIGLA